MYIIDKFLNEEDFQSITSHVLSNAFRWEYVEQKSRYPDGTHPATDYHNQQMTNVIYSTPNGAGFFENEKNLSVLLPIQKSLRALCALRVKINIQFPSKEVIPTPFHTDVDMVPDDVKVYSAILYLNTNDGYTVFEDTGEKVRSVENRIVVFDSQRKHAGTSFTNSRNRVVINLNFIPSSDTDFILDRY
jgi:hypothetical protein